MLVFVLNFYGSSFRMFWLKCDRSPKKLQHTSGNLFIEHIDLISDV